MNFNMQCSEGRSYLNASQLVLMEGTAYQEGDPIYENDSVTFLKFVVDQVEAADGSTYEVFFVAADVSGETLFI